MSLIAVYHPFAWEELNYTLFSPFYSKILIFTSVKLTYKGSHFI